MLPSIWSYCTNTTQSNAMGVTVGDIDYYFSYRTLVAFRAPGAGLVVRENDWGPTTGKHLNAIDDGDKADRVGVEEFQRLLAATSYSASQD
tara:strand:+ start:6743 stop:7015 length:273 start_codon:yes stop_codon:yes gene_type:complete